MCTGGGERGKCNNVRSEGEGSENFGKYAYTCTFVLYTGTWLPFSENWGFGVYLGCSLRVQNGQIHTQFLTNFFLKVIALCRKVIEITGHCNLNQ